ncbi:hypothetical protein OWM54_24990 [Myxococcus sp. MISCRS1]|uniref:DUF7107 domain-containing protein n=1 Tax=Myxococcus sp. MISCRS1 TaxID=2996786 RepID=UPI00226DB7B8|nr:hypothetical protein [Myxococcus sp. MISCRS1]MCY1000402.1 hypothetical protein [Myxococcus sp. MISCRS1]
MRTGWWLLGLCWLFACSSTEKMPPEPDVDPGPKTCARREDCDGGQVCTLAEVCGACESSGQCRLRERCEAGACVAREGWGEACVAHADCGLGQWCRQGLCRARADVVLCPMGTREECPTGERCNAGTLVCEEDLGCIEDSDCGAEGRCNPGLHACVPRCTEATASAVCAEGEHCSNERCVRCEEDSDCAVGFTCDAAGRCTVTPRCYSDRDCTVPHVCHLASGQCLPSLPPCSSDDDCESDRRCDLGSRACIPRSCQPDVLEPNDTVATAHPVSASRHVRLTLCPGDVDHYSLTLERGDQLGVNVEAEVFAEPVFSSSLQDASGRVLATGRFRLSHVVAERGLYTVRIASRDAVPRAYDVGFFLSRGTPCDDDDHEPNDTVETATALPEDLRLDGMLCPGDADHLRFSVPPSRGARVSLSGYTADRGLLRLCVLKGGTELGCSIDTTGATVELPASAVQGQSLTARVTGDDARTTNGYTLQVEWLP